MRSQNHFPKDKQTFFLPGPAGKLEVLTTYPKENAKNAVGIICHPHPLHEGTMHNKVVTTIARAFEILGLATVRFNYRGVGKSEGAYGETVGETEDLFAIIDWVKTTLPDQPLWLGGFSFGAYIAANVANQITAEQLVTVAPAVNHSDFTRFSEINCPWLVIQGEKDEIVPLQKVESWAANPPSPVTFKVIKEASHFFHGKLIELREIIVNQLGNNIQK